MPFIEATTDTGGVRGYINTSHIVAIYFVDQATTGVLLSTGARYVVKSGMSTLVRSLGMAGG